VSFGGIQKTSIKKSLNVTKKPNATRLHQSAFDFDYAEVFFKKRLI